MSSYYKETKNPNTGKWENALWIDDYYGKRRYGVSFPSGFMFDSQTTELETRDSLPSSPQEHCSGCTEKSWDLPEGRTHQMDTIEHPGTLIPQEDAIKIIRNQQIDNMKMTLHPILTADSLAPQEDTEQDWEKEFDCIPSEIVASYNSRVHFIPKYVVKDFIRNLLEKEKEKTIKVVREMIDEDHQCYPDGCFKCGRDEALKDVLYYM